MDPLQSENLQLLKTLRVAQVLKAYARSKSSGKSTDAAERLFRGRSALVEDRVRQLCTIYEYIYIDIYI